MQNWLFSFLVVAITIASTHFANRQRDGQTELAWVVPLSTNTVHPRTVTHLITYIAYLSSLSSLIVLQGIQMMPVASGIEVLLSRTEVAW